MLHSASIRVREIVMTPKVPNERNAIKLTGFAWAAVVCAIGLVLGISLDSSFVQTASAASSTGGDEGCSLSRLRGPYVLSINAYRSSPTPPFFTLSAYSPEGILGILTFDGRGSVSRSLSVNFAGNPPSPVTDSGSYQINPDCSGSATFPANSDTWSFNIVDSKSIAIVIMNPGEVGVGTLAKREVEDCSTEDLRGTFIFSISGLGTFQGPPQLADGFFPVSTVGSWTFDGKGGVSRVLSLNFAGLPFPYADTGSYQVNSDCTASVYFPSDNEPFQLIFVNARTAVTQPGGVGRTGTGSLLKLAL
jgi:hypothetical protein